MLKYKILISILFLIFSARINSQVVYEHVKNNNIYEFLDELANNQVISLNSCIKPYSRILIAEKLTEAELKIDKLNKRQKAELHFYLKSFSLETEKELDFPKRFDISKKNKNFATALNPIGMFYKDSFATFSLKPIWGIQYWSNKKGNVFHRWGGLEATGYFGKNFAFYANLRDNYESELLTSPTFFNQRQGAPTKSGDNHGYDYSEMRGGITYSWNWGSLGLIKDHLQWGNNYNGANILSGRQPSFAMIKLNLKPVKWFEFNYFHGWLVSEVVDSSRSYWDGNIYRSVFYPKFLAANMFTFIPWKRLNISIGNSVVYSDVFQAAYLIPFMFFKSIDHTLNATYSKGQAGQNSQMFFDISSRQIKHLHLYATLYVDDFSVKHLSKPDEKNFLSYKIGFKLSDFPIENLSLTSEYSIVNPLVYQHNISTTTFESNNYNLGYYLGDNSQEFYLALVFKPLSRLHTNLSYNFAQHGQDYYYKYTPSGQLHKLPLLEKITWQNNTFALKTNYEFVNNAYVFLHFIKSNIQGYDIADETAEYYLNRRTPEIFQGDNFTVSFGFNIGF